MPSNRREYVPAKGVVHANGAAVDWSLSKHGMVQYGPKVNGRRATFTLRKAESEADAPRRIEAELLSRSSVIGTAEAMEIEPPAPPPPPPPPPAPPAPPVPPPPQPPPSGESGAPSRDHEPPTDPICRDTSTSGAAPGDYEHAEYMENTFTQQDMDVDRESVGSLDLEELRAGQPDFESSLPQQVGLQPSPQRAAKTPAPAVTPSPTAMPAMHMPPPPPPPPPSPPRRTARETAGKPEPRFAASEHSQRDDHDAQRLGSRHGRVRDVSYDEALHQRDEAMQQRDEAVLQKETWLQEVRTLVEQSDAIISEMPTQHAAAARALQDALIDLVGEGDDQEDNDGNEHAEMCTPCTEPTEQECVAAAFFQQVADELAWSMPSAPPPSPPLALLKASFNDCAGGLVLTRSELLWVPMGAHFSEAKVRLPLSTIHRPFAFCFKSPFGNRAEVVIAMDKGDASAQFKFPCGSALADAELFALEVSTVIAAVPGATTTAATTASSVSAAAATTAATGAATSAPARRQTKQVRAAADLREKLKKVVDLQRSHAAGSNKEADALLEALAAGDGKAPSIHTIYKQSEHLRDVALGFGGYAISKRIIEQFLKMPAVCLLLPEALREQQRAASDAHVAKELMAQAKQFFTGIFGVGFRGGRLSDENRNAVAAASAAILPADLFKKRGRAAAASRLTGLGYRALHRGSNGRRELEDSSVGWRRVRTLGHKDKVDYGPLKEAWHSDLLSTEDNQNKDMVRRLLPESYSYSYSKSYSIPTVDDGDRSHFPTLGTSYLVEATL